MVEGRPKGKVVIIAMLDFPNGLGSTMRVKMLAKAFQSIGHEVYLVIPYASGLVAEGMNVDSEGEFEGIHFKYCSGSTKRPQGLLALVYSKFTSIPLVLHELWRINEKGSIDYLYIFGIHGTTIFEDVSYFKFAKLVGAKIIVDVSDAIKESQDAKSDMALIRYFLRKVKSLFTKLKGPFALARADYLIYASTYLKQYIEKFRKPDAIMLFVPVLIDRISIQGISHTPREDKKVIIYAGSFKAFEGLDFLIESLDALKSNFTEFVCYLYGANTESSYQEDVLRELVSRRSLEGHVLIRNIVPHDKLFQTLVNADVLVVPRRDTVVTRAGFSQKFGDYLLSGVPIVSTEVGEITKLLTNGREILFTPEGDARAFAEAIYYLFTHPAEGKEIGVNGQKFAIEHFDYRVLGARLAQMFDASRGDALYEITDEDGG